MHHIALYCNIAKQEPGRCCSCLYSNVLYSCSCFWFCKNMNNWHWHQTGITPLTQPFYSFSVTHGDFFFSFFFQLQIIKVQKDKVVIIQHDYISANFFNFNLLYRRNENSEGLKALYWTYLGMFWIQCTTTIVWVILIAKNRYEEGPTPMTKVSEF